MEQLSLFLGLSILVSVIAFAFAAYLYLWVKKQSTVNEKIIEVSALIKQGANTFMRREYKILGVFAAIISVLMFAALLLLRPQDAGAAVQDGLQLCAKTLVPSLFTFCNRR